MIEPLVPVLVAFAGGWACAFVMLAPNKPSEAQQRLDDAYRQEQLRIVSERMLEFSVPDYVACQVIEALRLALTGDLPETKTFKYGIDKQIVITNNKITIN